MTENFWLKRKSDFGKMPELGVEVNEVPVEERQKLGELMNDAIRDEIIASCGEEIYNMVNEQIKAERVQ